MKQKEYILGTHHAELHRLGLQHEVWSMEAHRAWEIAEFNKGHNILDIGCGPGFCTSELGYLVGSTGRVTGVDISDRYIHFVKDVVHRHGINSTIIQGDLAALDIEKDCYDGMWSRWVMAWIADVERVIDQLILALKPGGRMVFQEYFDWSVFQFSPESLHLRKGITACLRSFNESQGDINIGKELPRLLSDKGMEIISTRSISKMARPTENTWEWPRSFLEIYMPSLADMGYMTYGEVDMALENLEALTQNSNAIVLCPIVIEVIARRPLHV